MFIDDLCTFNNNEFENNYKDIYPDELELKKENEDPCKASFFDLSIEVHDSKFTTELFDKGMLFPFISIACSISMAIYYLKYFML